MCQAVLNEEEKVEVVEVVEVVETYAEIVASTDRELKEKLAEPVEPEPEPVVEPETEESEPVAVLEPETEKLEPEVEEEEEREEKEQIPEDFAPVATTSNPPVTKPRRRRGKRSGQQQRSAQLRHVEEKSSEPAEFVVPEIKVVEAVEHPLKEELPKSEDQWESVPAELKQASSTEMWETSSRSRRSKRGSRQQQSQFSPQPEDDEEQQVAFVAVEEEATPEPAVVEKAPEPVPEPAPEPVLPVSEPVQPAEAVAAVTEDSSERSSSAPSSRRSTLKKQNRKKRPSLDDDKSEKSGGSSIRPVLIQDGLIDITAGGLLMSRPLVKRPTDVLDEQALMIKDIGHGMRDGPITMGRFGFGKYTPPDRSDEILSSIVARQLKLDQLDEANATAVEAEEEKADVNIDATPAVVANGNPSQDLDLD